jgi:hypothetical protein
MVWNYRILRSPEGLFGLYEVYYDDGGEPEARSDRPATMGGFESQEDIIEDLKLMLKGAEGKPVLDDPWP